MADNIRDFGAKAGRSVVCADWPSKRGRSSRRAMGATSSSITRTAQRGLGYGCLMRKAQDLKMALSRVDRRPLGSRVKRDALGLAPDKEGSWRDWLRPQSARQISNPLRISQTGRRSAFERI